MPSLLVSQLVYENFRPRVRRTRKLDRLFPSTYNLPKLLSSRENLADRDSQDTADTAIVEDRVQPTSQHDADAAPTSQHSTKTDDVIKSEPEGKKHAAQPREGKWQRLWRRIIQSVRKPKDSKPVKVKKESNCETIKPKTVSDKDRCQDFK